MLARLQVQNIVLIDKLALEFERGLCVLTGETGAGKSIVLDALGLALGARGTQGLVRAGCESGSVVAEFDIAQNEGAKTILTELGLEVEDALIIRRAITADGKSKAFINDVAVSVQALKTLGESLLEIHGQHEQQGLFDIATHRANLDAYGALEVETQQVSSAYHAMKSAREVVAALLAEIESARREEEYLRHTAKELEALAPQAGEETALLERRTILSQSGKLKATVSEALNALTGKDTLGNLRSAHRTLTRSQFTQNETALIASLEQAMDAIETVQDGLMQRLDAQGGEAALEALEDRLHALRGMARKYNVTCDALGELYEDACKKLALIKSNDAALKEAEAAQKKAVAAFKTHAEGLSKKRISAAAQLEQKIAKELAGLKMANTKVVVQITPLDEAQWNESGIDKVQFMVATNAVKGAEATLSPIHKIASGGELSRFMLGLKVAFAHVKSTPSLIFDEIDTGTGGAVAEAIGKRLHALAQIAQVFVVTHLPQVAAYGQQHMKVEKTKTKTGFITTAHVLDKKDRKEELARMLAGETITDEARKAAAKLLEHAA